MRLFFCMYVITNKELLQNSVVKRVKGSADKGITHSPTYCYRDVFTGVLHVFPWMESQADGAIRIKYLFISIVPKC